MVLTTIFGVSLLGGCLEPPSGVEMEPETDMIDLNWDGYPKFDNSGNQVVEWVVSGNITNNDDKTLEWILIRAYFYDEAGKKLLYHESYEYENLPPGQSIDFKINWYFGDEEGDLIADLEGLPQSVTGECEIVNLRFSDE